MRMSCIEPFIFKFLSFKGSQQNAVVLENDGPNWDVPYQIPVHPTLAGSIDAASFNLAWIT